MLVFSYAHFLCAFVYAALAAYLLLVRDPPRGARSLGWLCACLAFWSGAYVLVENPHVDKQAAVLLEKLSAPGWLFFPVFYLWFCADFTRACHAWPCRLMPFVAPALVLAFVWDGQVLSDHVRTPFGWAGQWALSPWTVVYYAYLVAYIVYGSWLLHRHACRSASRITHHQVKTVLVAVAIAFPLGAFANIGTRLLGWQFPSVADAAGLLWVAAMVFATVRYGFLDLLPNSAANSVVAAMSEFMFVLDRDDRIVAVNESALSALGYVHSQVVGRDFRELLTHDNDTKVLRVKPTTGTLVKDITLSLCTSSGTSIPVSASLSRVDAPDGTNLGTACLARDITLEQQAREAMEWGTERLEREVVARTRELREANQQLRHEVSERERAEREARASEERFRLLFEYAPDAIYLSDLNGVFLDGNRRAEQLVGRERSELIGTDLAHAGVLLPSELPRALASFADTIAGRPTGPEEFTVVRGDGTTVEAEISTYLVAIGEERTALSVARDVSARKAVEQRQLQSEKMDAIGQLAGGIAHDFNNMLGVIIGYTEMLVRRCPTAQTALHGYAERVLTAARRSADLTSKLLTFARKGQGTRAAVDVHKVIEEVMGLLQHSLDPRITLVPQLEAHQRVVTADAAQIESALLNLGVNARDAMPEGGTLRIATATVQLDEGGIAGFPRSRGPGPYLCITVQDTGTGMSPETRKRAFEPFFTTKELGKGTGLGLSSVYGTVEDHGGVVELESALGVGTTFRLYLPLLDSDTGADADPGQTPAAHGAGTVLVVDDDEMMCGVTVEMLEELGYTALACGDGAQAVEVYRTRGNEIDVVLLDMLMPVLSGRDCYYQLRELDPDVRVIVASGYSNEGDVKKLLAEGALGFVQKPYSVDELALVVKEAVARR